MSEAEREAIARFERDVVGPSMTSLVILQFTAEWCGPCKQLSPILDKVVADHADQGVCLKRIDIDQEKVIAAQFRIQSVPTVYALFQGQPVADLTSYRTEGQLARALEQLLAQLPVQGQAQQLKADIAPLLAMAEQVLGEGDAARAANIFLQIRDMAPGDPEATAGLARALLAEGRVEEARALSIRSTQRQPSTPPSPAPRRPPTSPERRSTSPARRHGSPPIRTIMKHASPWPTAGWRRATARPPPTR